MDSQICRYVRRALVLAVVSMGLSCNTDVVTQTVLRFAASPGLSVPEGTTIRVRAWRMGERQHEPGQDMGTVPFAPDTQLVINAADNDGSRRFTVFAELLSPTGVRVSWARVRTGHIQDQVSEVRIDFADGCRAASGLGDDPSNALPFAMCGSHETCAPMDEGSECASPCYEPEPFVAERASTPSTPVLCPSDDGLSVDELIVGWNFSCALAQGEAYCWGSHTYGNAPESTTRERPSRVFNVQGLPLPTEDPIVSMDLEIHTLCAIHASGRLACGGLRDASHIGVELPEGQRYVPCCALSPDLPPLADFRAALGYALALTEDGALYRIDGTETRLLPSPTLVDEMIVGYYRALTYGASGAELVGLQGPFVEGSLPPAPSTFLDVESRNRSVCGVTADGELLCWGEPPTDVGSFTDQPTSLGEGWSRIGWGLFNLSSAMNGDEDEVAHACGVRTDGALVCWGRNVRSRLGAPAAVPSAPAASPTRVGSDSDWADVGPGHNHTCALKRDGRVFCFGDNSWGQLGVEGPETFVPQEVVVPAW